MTARALRRCLDMATVRQWADVVDDHHNPLHLDPDFAARSRFGGPIVHGSLLFALISDAAQAAGHIDTVAVRFLAPVPAGSQVGVHIDGTGALLWCEDLQPVEVTTSARASGE